MKLPTPDAAFVNGNEADMTEQEREVIEVAADLVALWKAQKIKGLPRAERNAAIEGVRERLIKAVEAVS